MPALERICSVPGCQSEHLARGFCKKHYQRYRNGDRGEALTRPHGKRQPLEDFWCRADSSEGPHHCWIWRGAVTAPMGYGNVKVDGRNIGAHRRAWELAHGPIPEGMFVLHRCDNPPCVNPAHLFLGTHADNMADMKAKGRVRKPRSGSR